MSVTIRVTIETSFHGTKTYRLKKVHKGDDISKYQVTVDESEFHGYRITPALVAYEIATEAVESAITELMSLSVSICPEPVMGLDGTTTSIEIQSGMNKVMFSWWEKPPEQWENLKAVFKLFDVRPSE